MRGRRWRTHQMLTFRFEILQSLHFQLGYERPEIAFRLNQVEKQRKLGRLLPGWCLYLGLGYRQVLVATDLGDLGSHLRRPRA